MKKKEKSDFEKNMMKVRFFIYNVVRPIVNILTNLSKKYSKYEEIKKSK